MMPVRWDWPATAQQAHSLPQTPTGCFLASDCRYMLYIPGSCRSCGQAEDWHVVIDNFIIPRMYKIRLVPDTNAPICTNRFIKTPPGFEMRVLFTARKVLQVLKRLPVLDRPDTWPINEWLPSKIAKRAVF